MLLFLDVYSSCYRAPQLGLHLTATTLLVGIQANDLSNFGRIKYLLTLPDNDRRVISGRSSTERRLDALLALAEPLFHSGLYKQAGKAYSEAAALAYGGKDWVKIVKAEMGIVESDRVAGRMLRAWRRIERLARTLPQQAPPEERERVSS